MSRSFELIRGWFSSSIDLYFVSVLYKQRDLFQPMEVYVDDDSKLTLHGLQQHYVKLKDNEKNRKLFELLDALEFNQACSTKHSSTLIVRQFRQLSYILFTRWIIILYSFKIFFVYVISRIHCDVSFMLKFMFQVIIFVKSIQRCMALSQLLVEQNFPAIAIHRAMSQDDRYDYYQIFKPLL